MSSLGPDIAHFIQCDAVRHRVALVEDTGPALVVRDASSIASPVPYLRLDAGRAEFSGWRRRLEFPGEHGPLRIRARVRAVPDGISSRARITHVRDEHGRDCAVCAADPVTRTVHLLVEIDRAVVADEPSGRLAVGVAETLAGRAIPYLMTTDAAPWVGDGVPEAVRALLARRLRGIRPRFEREIAFLRRAARGNPLPGALARRLEMLEAAVNGERPRKVKPGAAERETERLVRLVESRACASLRLAPDEIRGLINPRAMMEGLGHGPLMFSLQPGPAPGGPRLRMWRTGEPEHGTSRTMCLGAAAGVLHRMEDAQDVYGLVDTVLNFVETNSVGWVPLDSAPGHRSFAAALEHLF